MRWDNLAIEHEEQAMLPGYRDPAAVRRFDAPEALDTRFYEVRAKSILNKVPPQSRMPFRWTINPYRGCSHACLYCAAGETGVLMADGRVRELRELRVGDSIVGTRQEGAYRRFVTTEILAKWSSIKPAFRVELEDGTAITASGDHRFLTSRGWEHVLGTEGGGPLRRPHLTLNSKLLGPGGYAEGPQHDEAYRRGYITGMIRGDGHLGRHSYERPGRACGDAHRFRLALVDDEALSRAERYLADFDVHTTRFASSAGSAVRRPIGAVGTSARAAVERIGELIAWPVAPDESWRKGFLAGIFDAEGSCDGEALRIHTGDTELIRWIVACLRSLRFEPVIEDRLGTQVKAVRLRGGLPERMRFFLGTDPAITRKRILDGKVVKSNARLRVVSIRPLGIAMRMYDITTGTEDFIANGVVSHNCFARPTHTYLGFDAGRDFEREIVVKVNAPERVRAELARRSWKREHVALGTNTDPYQWVEGRYKLMEGIWEAMRDASNPCSILTKSPLLLRDLKLMQEIRARTEFSACLSIPTLDEKAWRATEPRTPNPRARLEAVAELNRAGIPTGVLIAPLMPGINDAPEQLEPLLEAAHEAGAINIGGVALHLRGEVRDVFMGWLRDARPELVPRYEQLYAGRAYAPQPERERLARMVRRGGPPGAFWRGHEGADGRARGQAGPSGARGIRRPERASERGGERETIELAAAAEPVQGSLF